MPQLISLKFSELEMPTAYRPGPVEDLQLQDFVWAEREGSEDVGFVAAIEWVSKEQLKLRPEPYKPLLRRASEEEKEKFFVRRAFEKKAMALCKERARALGLPMKISHVRMDAKEPRFVFHFTSDQRVDFRQLVRELSAGLKARIELWQIGVRDEAKMLDGFGMCGLRTCCSTWLPDFRPINLRMAKDQDINLPPSKLSGLCGRLLCCLSYEVDQYREVGKQLLSKGSTITVDGRQAVIIDRNIMLQQYTIQFAEGGTTVVRADDLSDVRVPDQMKRMGKVLGENVEEPERASESPTASATVNDEGGGDADSESKKKRRRRRRPKSKQGDKGSELTASGTENEATDAHAKSTDDQRQAKNRRSRRSPRRKGSDGQAGDRPRESGASGEGSEKGDGKPGGRRGKRRRRGGRGKQSGGERSSGGE